MIGEWLPNTILRAAALLAPREQRTEWLEEWRAELWYVPRNSAMRFCLGAFRDAIWLRRNAPSPMKPTLFHMESPVNCLVFLAALAAVSVWVVLHLPGLEWPSHLRGREVLTGCLLMLVLSCLLLPPTRLAMAVTAARGRPVPWPNRLRRGIFLLLKIALVQPIMLCWLLVPILAGPLVALGPVGWFVGWILVFRWVLTDQRRRCPVCLRLLVNPIRIGTSSQTFLDWYGAESMCSHGHGLLRVPEASNGQPEWLYLGPSWQDLFAESSEGRRSR